MHQMSIPRLFTGGVRWFALAACGAVLVACGSTPETVTVPMQPQAQAEQSEYKIGPGDTLQVFVWNQPELTVTVPVRPDGDGSEVLPDFCARSASLRRAFSSC